MIQVARRVLAVVVAAAGIGGCVSHTPPAAIGPDAPPSAPAISTPAAPSPSPSPAKVLGCGLPPGGGSGANCPYQEGIFALDVNEAIAEAANEHPELFDLTDSYGGLSWRVLDRQKYYDTVKHNLERMGYCAAHDLEEIGVKNDNRFNEQYQIMTSYGYSRWGAGAYRATCWPAWF
jgi:hypothetical protein